MSQILVPQGIASFLKMSHNVKNVTKSERKLRKWIIKM